MTYWQKLVVIFLLCAVFQAVLHKVGFTVGPRVLLGSLFAIALALALPVKDKK